MKSSICSWVGWRSSVMVRLAVDRLADLFSHFAKYLADALYGESDFFSDLRVRHRWVLVRQSEDALRIRCARGERDQCAIDFFAFQQPALSVRGDIGDRRFDLQRLTAMF